MRSRLVTILFFSITHLSAQVDPNGISHSLRSVGLSFHKGFIFAHSKDVQNTDGSYPWGVQLEWNWHKRNQQTWDNCYCYPRTGIQLQYFNYDNRILGHSFHANGYIEPYFNATQRIQFSVKGMAGLAYLTNPFHVTRNPTNMSYSLPVSGFVALGLGVHWNVNDRVKAHVYANYNHISNGGIKDPNKGINWPTLSIGFDYAREKIHFPVREKSNNMHYTSKPVAYLVSAYWSSKTVVAGEKSRWMIGGLSAQASKQVSLINAINIEAEIWLDNALEERLRRDGNPELSSVRSGVLLGNAFLMGKFTLSQQLGAYVWNETRYFNRLYQRYGLMYRLFPSVQIGFNVLAHGHVANFLDFRAGYQF